MRWTLLSLAGVLSSTGASVSSDSLLKSHVDLSLVVNSLPQTKASHPFKIQNATTLNLFSRFLHHLDMRQDAGRCGTTVGGARCPGNQCCSTFDYCGTDQEHCSLLVGCQPQFGRCGDAAPDPTPTPTPSSSPTPTPTPTPTPSPSSSSVVIPSSSSSVLPPLPSGTLIVSPNGQCGNTTTCSGSAFGSCCSEFYFCGTGSQYCGTGCRSAFGTCNGVVPPVASSTTVPISSFSSVLVSSSTIPIPTSTPSLPSTSTSSPTPSSSAPAVPTNVSTNGRCGAEGSGTTCQGSTFGRCCSDYGWCGSSDDYCRLSYGCRPNFGTCG